MTQSSEFNAFVSRSAFNIEKCPGLEDTVLVGFGAIAIDTILTVPHFPPEDSKLRATKVTKRRGGNIGNTFEVLNQLRAEVSRPKHTLYLLASLPEAESDATSFIERSFVLAVDGHLEDSWVNTRYCLFNNRVKEPISSYIVSSQETGTRTIINHNDIQEMSLHNFESAMNDIRKQVGVRMRYWCHFEGRIPHVTSACIKQLRSGMMTMENVPKEPIRTGDTVSVEIEKPGREGLQDLAYLANVVFYSKSWAEAEGHKNAEECVKSQAQRSLEARSPVAFAYGQTMICTWGEQGAYAVRFAPLAGKNEVVFEEEARSPAFEASAPVVDTVGAGDSFIAAMLFGFMKQPRTAADQREGAQVESLQEILNFACMVAGLKVVQDGFRDLGQQLRRG